jgi:ligand-binding SRPBCC domain-containing protein
MTRLHRLTRTQVIPRPRAEVFAFFSDAAHLEYLTPAFLHFRIVTPLPIAMGRDTRIEYALSLWGVPVHWRTRISVWEPDVRFVDEQEAGPYAEWRHLHEFESLGSETRMRDVVDYRLPLGALGSLAHALWVERSLDRIFDYRRGAILDRL